MLMGISVGGVLLAILYAYIKYIKNNHVPVLDTEPRSALAKISYSKFYFDEFYNAIIQKPLDALSVFFYKVIDKSGIDALVNGLGKGSIEASKTLRLLQTGNVGFYIFAMVIGVVALLLYSFFKF
jgi:NADH-quinone oxidoreductase subunit L